MNALYYELGRATAELNRTAADALKRLNLTQKTLRSLTARATYPMEQQPIRAGSTALHSKFVSEVTLYGGNPSHTVSPTQQPGAIHGDMKLPIDDGSRHIMPGGVPIPYVPRTLTVTPEAVVVKTNTMFPSPEEAPYIVYDHGFETSFQKTTRYDTRTGNVQLACGMVAMEGPKILESNISQVCAIELPPAVSNPRMQELLTTTRAATVIFAGVENEHVCDVTWEVT